MSKKIVVVSSSPHKVSNSELLALEFVKGAESIGHNCKVIKVRDLNIKFCKGCLACAKEPYKCVQRDDVNKKMLDEIREADILVFATPVYYYAVSGQLKTFIDRMNPIYCSGFNFKELYVFSTAADDSVRAFKGIKEDIKGFIDCYEGVKLKGSLFVGSLHNGGDVKKNTKALKEAYEMGAKVKG